jgi:hypothetical protein
VAAEARRGAARRDERVVKGIPPPAVSSTDTLLRRCLRNIDGIVDEYIKRAMFKSQGRLICRDSYKMGFSREVNTGIGHWRLSASSVGWW